MGEITNYKRYEIVVIGKKELNILSAVLFKNKVHYYVSIIKSNGIRKNMYNIIGDFPDQSMLLFCFEQYKYYLKTGLPKTKTFE